MPAATHLDKLPKSFAWDFLPSGIAVGHRGNVKVIVAGSHLGYAMWKIVDGIVTSQAKRRDADSMCRWVSEVTA